VAGELPAEARAPVTRVHDQADLADVVRPAVPREHRDEADDPVVLVQCEPLPTRVQPRADRTGSVDVLLHEGAVPLGELGEEAGQGVDVGVVDRDDAGSHDATPSAGSSLRRRRKSMMVGIVVRAAVRPTTSPMWPASRRSSWRSGEPTRSISGAAASSGTM
jgi:hypothetical protein